MSEPCYIPTGNVQRFQFLHMIAHTDFPFFCIVAVLMGMWWYLILVLNFISLMANDVEHSFAWRLNFGVVYSIASPNWQK